jgi:hypothetical protein
VSKPCHFGLTARVFDVAEQADQKGPLIDQRNDRLRLDRRGLLLRNFVLLRQGTRSGTRLFGTAHEAIKIDM